MSEKNDKKPQLCCAHTVDRFCYLHTIDERHDLKYTHDPKTQNSLKKNLLVFLPNCIVDMCVEYTKPYFKKQQCTTSKAFDIEKYFCNYDKVCKKKILLVKVSKYKIFFETSTNKLNIVLNLNLK